MIEINYIPDLPQIPYRNGVGQWEGLVMHSTAVYGDDAAGERQYECGHFKEAFVHAFSDPHSTIETANPQYIAWGAGQVANYRYLHSELCQVRNDGTQAATDNFKASYDNWITYAAQRLHDRKLGVSVAKSDGTGTLWQHYQVSQYLGDSNHVDPMDYLSTWNLTWGNVVADVQTRYKELDQMDELLKRVAALEYQLIKAPAPAWFVTEFKSADLGGMIHDPLKTEEFWEGMATILRAIKWQPTA